MAIGTTAALVGGALIGGAVLSKGSKVSAPAPRDYYSEGRDTLQAQIDLAPQLYAAEANPDYGRQAYANLDMSILEGMMPRVSELERTATSTQREGDIADVERLGGRATEAFRAANPQLAQIQDMLFERAQAGGDSEIMNRLKMEAMTDLKRGGSLSPEEQRMASQSARAAFNSRGIARGDAGVFGEVLNSDRYSNQRQAQRRQFAMGVDSADLQRQQYGSNLMGTTGQFLSATSSDPFQAILGRSASPSGIQGAGFSLQSQPQIFNPFDPYSGALNASNQQNIMDARTATAANRASIGGSVIGALGTIGGAYVGKMCWVAREVYGPYSPRWLMFREWLMNYAPKWLVRAYAKHGQAFAAWLYRHPKAKAPIRFLMDRAIDNLDKRHARA